MDGLRFAVYGDTVLCALGTDSDYDDDDYYDDVGLNYGVLQDQEVSLATIHDDLLLLHFTILAIFFIVFVLFLVQKWR